MLIGVISDTHGYVNPRLYTVFDGVEHIIHAGDVGDDGVLNELESIAPTTAVSGNMDGMPTARRPYTRVVTLGDTKIAIYHGHRLDAFGGSIGESLKKMFEKDNPDIIIHGHTHRAEHYRLDAVLVINPGTACRSGSKDGKATVALIQIDSPHKYSVKIVDLAQEH